MNQFAIMRNQLATQLPLAKAEITHLFVELAAANVITPDEAFEAATGFAEHFDNVITFIAAMETMGRIIAKLDMGVPLAEGEQRVVREAKVEFLAEVAE